MRILTAALTLLLAGGAAAQPPMSFMSDAELGAAVAAAARRAAAALPKPAEPSRVPVAGPVGAAPIATLFAFAIKHGAYGEWCRVYECRPAAVILIEPSEFVRQDRSGWYNGGNAYVKNRPNAVSLEITTVHELTHHLQRASNRYFQYRGVCNQYLAEKEAYEVAEAYAQTKGFTTRYEPRLAPFLKRCRDAVAAGLVMPPAGLTIEPAVR